MTTEEYIKKNRVALEAIVKLDIPLKIAVYTIVGEQSIRIFQDGLNSAGSKIGSYNNSVALYVNTTKSAPIKNAPKGKNGDVKFKNGNPHKSTYYKSYKEFRSKQKRESGFVNLRLTNELQSDFSNSKVSVSSTKVVAGKPIKVNVHFYKTELKKDINQKKREGLENKYGRIFKLTKEEKTKFLSILQKELKIALL